MSSPSDKRLIIAAVLYPVLQSLLFGASVVLVAVGLADHVGLLLPYAAIVQCGDGGADWPGRSPRCSASNSRVATGWPISAPGSA